MIIRSIRALLADPIGAMGLMLIALMFLMALCAPFLPMHDPLALSIENRLRPPSSDFWMGTDQVGRDILSRVVWGARASLAIGLGAVVIGLLLGVTVGLLAGYRSGTWLDEILMKLMEILAAIPLLIWVIAIVGITGTATMHFGVIPFTNEFKLVILIGVLYAPGLARLTYSLAQVESHAEYVFARKLQGASTFQIILTDVMPNVISPVVIQATLLFGVTIVLEASLSFIGLGVQPPTPSWGAMLSDARALIFSDAWWVSFFPGMAVFISVLGFNLFGDSLRTLLDPRRKSHVVSTGAPL
ncbi:putative D,D-dipeptide transport system permease protein DdpC [compost metagenome]